MAPSTAKGSRLYGAAGVGPVEIAGTAMGARSCYISAYCRPIMYGIHSPARSLVSLVQSTRKKAEEQKGKRRPPTGPQL